MSWKLGALAVPLILTCALLAIYAYYNSHTGAANPRYGRVGAEIKHSLGAAGPHSFYFEDLVTGETISAGETIQAPVLSLAQVPAVMDLYYAAEHQRIDLGAPITAAVPNTSASHTPPLRETARLALEKSDNTAAKAINHFAREKVAANENAAFALGVKTQPEDATSYYSAREYSKYLKCLYRSCYINKSHSDEVLSMLGHDGSRALGRYLPRDVKVVHKASDANEGGFCDCGIVLAPKHPYLECFMVDEPRAKAEADVAAMSKRLYDTATKN